MSADTTIPAKRKRNGTADEVEYDGPPNKRSRIRGPVAKMLGNVISEVPDATDPKKTKCIYSSFKLKQEVHNIGDGIIYQSDSCIAEQGPSIGCIDSIWEVKGSGRFVSVQRYLRHNDVMIAKLLREDYRNNPSDAIPQANPQREVVQSTIKEEVPISAIEGKCIIQHVSEVLDWNRLNTTQHWYYYRKLFDEAHSLLVNALPILTDFMTTQTTTPAIDGILPAPPSSPSMTPATTNSLPPMECDGEDSKSVSRSLCTMISVFNDQPVSVSGRHYSAGDDHDDEEYPIERHAQRGTVQSPGRTKTLRQRRMLLADAGPSKVNVQGLLKRFEVFRAYIEERFDELEDQLTTKLEELVEERFAPLVQRIQEIEAHLGIERKKPKECDTDVRMEDTATTTTTMTAVTTTTTASNGAAIMEF